MKTNLMPTWQPTYHGSEDNPEGELAAYGLLRKDIKEDLKDTEQKGRKAFGIEETNEGLEIVMGDDNELVEYGVDLAVIATDSKFELITRKENADALQNMNESKLRAFLRRLLSSV